MKRNGLTLLEVLIAIFIMGIGMLGILAMFPVAADMLGRAINNNQMAEGMVGARSVQDNFDIITSEFSYLLRKAPTYQIGTPNDPDAQTSSTYKSGGGVVGVSNLQVGWLAGEQPRTDYPLYLFVDQYAAISNVSRFLKAPSDQGLGIDNAFIPQIDYPIIPYPKLKKFSNITMNQFAGRFFTVNGDILLNKDGLANKDDDGSSVTLDRPGRFTLAYFYEKPFPRSFSNVSNRYIFVFRDRAETIKDYPLLKEDLTAPTLNPNLTSFVNIPDPGFDIRPRQWLAATALKFGATMPPSLVDFVEIKSVNQNLANGTFDVEVSPPVRGAMNRLYFLTDVSYVFYTGR
jgi:prepilin-type N-terminal cleavage/methylation domain-containing protein